MAIASTDKLIIHSYGLYDAYNNLSAEMKSQTIFFCTDPDTSDKHGIIRFNGVDYGRLTSEQLKSVNKVLIADTPDGGPNGQTLTIYLTNGSQYSAYLLEGSQTEYGVVKVDTTPIAGSTNAVQSGGLLEYLSAYYAGKVSPTFAGTPKTPTASEGTNDTQIANTEFVLREISSALTSSGAMRPKGTVGAGGSVTSLPTTNVVVGDTYIVYVAGTYAGQSAKAGDMFIAKDVAPSWWYVPSGNEVETFLKIATQYSDVNINTTAKNGTIALGTAATKFFCDDYEAVSSLTPSQYVPTVQLLLDALTALGVDDVKSNVSTLNTKVSKNESDIATLSNSCVWYSITA